MKILFFGAGVLGSLYAARLHEAGIDVALVARGKRLEDIKRHGVVLEDFKSGDKTITQVRVLDEMPADEYFDVCVVLVQKTQLQSALSTLSSNPHIPTFLFMNNTAQGPQEMIDRMGYERVMLGHANAGGERIDHVVHYMVASEMTLGELDGKKSERLHEIGQVFKRAGFKVAYSRNIDAWKRYHVALAVPFADAMYKVGGCNYQLGKDRESTKKCIHGIREAFRVLKAHGFPVEPFKLGLILSIPDFIIVPLFQLLLRSKIADIGMARHLKNAREEMMQLRKEFQVLVESSGQKTPIMEELQKKADLSLSSS